MKKLKIKIPKWIKRIKKEERDLWKKAVKLKDFVEGTEIILSEQQVEMFERQVKAMRDYGLVLSDRISYEMSELAESEVDVEAGGVTGISINDKGKITIYETMEELIHSIIERKKKESKDDRRTK